MSSSPSPFHYNSTVYGKKQIVERIDELGSTENPRNRNVQSVLQNDTTAFFKTVYAFMGMIFILYLFLFVYFFGASFLDTNAADGGGGGGGGEVGGGGAISVNRRQVGYLLGFTCLFSFLFYYYLHYDISNLIQSYQKEY